jgi:hypothetical protein
VYLVYDNPARLEWSQAADKRVSDQLEALTTALSIGRVLKRIVILPRFHCIHDKSKTLYDCPLNSFIYIPKFDSQFKSSYRESSFLHHPLVPDAIRNSITSQRNVIDRTPNETLSMVTVTSEELQRRFGDVTTRILRLESLYNLRVQFTSPVEQLAFASSIQHALTQCDYRQQIMKQDSGSKVAAGPKK